MTPQVTRARAGAGVDPAAADRVGLVGLARVAGEHRDDDAQVEERGDDRGQDADDRRATYSPASAAAANTSSLATKPPVSGMPACASRKKREQAGRARAAARQAAVVVDRVVVVAAARRARVTTANDADGHERVREQVEERRLSRALGAVSPPAERR